MAELALEVLDEIRALARRELDFKGPIELASSLQHDLQLDSMAMIVVAVGLENRFRVRLQEDGAGTIATVGDLVKLVCRRMAEQHAGAVPG